MSRLPSYDIFISYRREGADATARLLYERLLRDGYRVAFDLETLRSGDFDEQILEAIRGCRDVIVVLGPGSLDRCRNPGDWVRLEIACALESGKNVIPLMLRGFTFPPVDELPPEIRRIRKKQGVSASMEHLDSSIGRLKALLTSKPTLLSHRRTLGWLANLAVVALAAAGIALVWPRPDPDPNPPKNNIVTNNPVTPNRFPEWISGTLDSDTERPHGIRTDQRGIWRPLPGWRVRQQGFRPHFEWAPGSKTRRHPHIHATDILYGDGSGDWDPDVGYAWRDAASPRRDPDIPSSPDSEHPTLPTTLLPDPTPGSDAWIPGRHLVWANDNPNDLSVSNDWTVVWVPGWTPAPDAHVRAGEKEGDWLLDPGYVRTSLKIPVLPEDLAVVWSNGLRHPLNPHAYAAPEPGQWLLDPGYAWLDPANPSAGAVWTPGTPHPDHPELHAAGTLGEWLPVPDAPPLSDSSSSTLQPF